MKPGTLDNISNIIEESVTPAVITLVEKTVVDCIPLLIGTANPIVVKFSKYLIKLTFDRFIVPALMIAERKGLLLIDRKRGMIILKNFNEAEAQHDKIKFDSAFDSI